LKNALDAAAAARHPQDDASVAAARGLTVEQLRAIREQRSLTNEQVLTLGTPRLQRFVQRLTEPKMAPGDYFRYRNSFLVNEDGVIPEGAMARAFAQARQMPLDSRLLPAAPDAERFDMAATTDEVTPSSWTWRGPGSVGGRIRAMLIHPTDPNRMWIGSAGGGIWKTTNGGGSWSPVDDFMPSLAVCALAFNPANPNIMYAGTGEGTSNADAIRGVGLFKSIDGGTTWTHLASTGTSDFDFTMRLAVSSTGTTILAATGAGIMRSTDSGATWARAYTSTSRPMCHVQFDPMNNARAIASGFNGQLLYSTNGGLNWQTPAGSLPGGGISARVESAYAPSDPSIVYALAEGQGFPPTRFFKSTDHGQTFAQVAISGSPDISGGQGSYDLLVWVDPTNPNLVVAGGVDLFRSTNGGLNFTNITTVYSGGAVHPDQHLVVHDPRYNGTTNRRIYALHDGGISRQDDISTAAPSTGWMTLNNNLGITQFYAGAGNPATGMLIGGTQDLGTMRLVSSISTPNAWSGAIGGDGGYAAVDQTNGQYVYGEAQNLALRRSTNSGTSFSPFTTGITGAPEFIAPFILDPNNQNVLLYGSQALFRSVGARSGAAFTSIKAASSTPSVKISAIGVAPGNSNIIYVGYNHVGGGVHKTTNGTAAAPTWSQVGAGVLPTRRVTRFAIDPFNNDRAIVSFGGFLGGHAQSFRSPDNLWMTTDGGTTWTNIHGNLPPAPIYTVVMDPGGDPQRLYVGTDAGVYASADSGATWTGTNVGPSTSPVVDLFFMNRDLVAVTHGRGIYMAPASVDALPPTARITPDRTTTNASPIVFRFTFNEPVTGFTPEDVVVTNGTAGAVSGSNASYTLPVTPSGSGPVSVSLPAGTVLDIAGNSNAVAFSATDVFYDATSPFFYISTLMARRRQAAGLRRTGSGALPPRDRVQTTPPAAAKCMRRS
jgi:photosystem II stability/assembly factor-like uncharacterized protein